MTSTRLLGKYSNYHYCVVRECNNTSLKTPGKLWIRLPDEINMRNTLMKLAKRNPDSLTTETHYICQDHFELGNDVKNFMHCKILGSDEKIQMQPKIILSRFDCHTQKNRKIARKSDKLRHTFISTAAVPVSEDIEQSEISEQSIVSRGSEVRACRACLATSGELQNLHTSGLGKVFAHLSGFPMIQSDRYPQLICNMCLHMLRKLLVFRRRCQSTMNTLKQIEAHRIEITTQSLSVLEDKYAYRLTKSSVETISVDATISPSTILTFVKDDMDPVAVCKVESSDDENKIDEFTDDDGEHCNMELNSEFLQTHFRVCENNNNNSKEVDTHVDNINNEEASRLDICTSGLLPTTVEVEESTEFKKINKRDIITDNNIGIILDNINSIHNINSYRTLQTQTELVDSTNSKKTKLNNMNTKVILAFSKDNNEKRKNDSLINEIHTASCQFACDMCSFVTTSKTGMILHTKAHSKGSPASSAIESRNQKIRILKKSHTLNTFGNLYSCNVCHKEFEYKYKLITHKRIHTGEKPYSCDVCDKSFCQKGNLISHKRTHTGDKPYSCKVCHKNFSSCRYLVVHNRIHTGEKPYSCNICHKKFTHKNCVTEHRRVHTGERKFSCDVCNKKFATSGTLMRHQKVHTGEKPYSCNICHKNFKEICGVVRHLKTHTGDKPYYCDVCHKNFCNKVHLRRHIKTHTGEKPYSCNICHKKFTEKYSVTLHQRSHTGEKPYSCSVCYKKFTSRSHLTRHQKVHTSEKPYCCKVCYKTFKCSLSLTRHHTLMHTDVAVKPYSCDICQKTFSLEIYLRNHKKIHTDVKPYACDVCHKQFKRKIDLTTHKRYHTGDKRYSCNICHKKFFTSSDICRHRIIHTGVQPYSCNVCQRNFNLKSNLERHKKKHIGEKP